MDESVEQQEETFNKETSLCVWIDGDSCPKELRKFLLRTAKRLNPEKDAQERKNGLSVPFCFVAAKQLPLTTAPFISCTLVEPGQDASDHFILQHCNRGDIVITRDIVFAERICCRDDGVCVLNDRGVEYSRENVSARRRQRDVNLELRQLGLLSSGKSSYSAKDLQQFANGFDRCLTRNLKDSQRAMRGV